jgi:hypothetical protein
MIEAEYTRMHLTLRLTLKLESEPTPTTKVSTVEWLRHFDAWISSLESRNPDFDDSRESIYEDR